MSTPLHEWEHVSMLPGKFNTIRMRAPGGWLYMSSREQWTGDREDGDMRAHFVQSMCFVPCPRLEELREREMELAPHVAPCPYCVTDETPMLVTDAGSFFVMCPSCCACGPTDMLRERAEAKWARPDTPSG